MKLKRSSPDVIHYKYWRIRLEIVVIRFSERKSITDERETLYSSSINYV